MEKFDMEKLYEKAGGIFRLTVLVQKRLKQLNSGSPKMIEVETKNLKEIVFHEILAGKIALVATEVGEEVEVVEPKMTDNLKEMFQKKDSAAELPTL